MNTIREIFGRGYQNDRIGLELELESKKPQPLEWLNSNSMWTVHNDGSLRQNGIEYVFASPLWGGDIDAALQVFEDNTKSVSFIDTGYGSTHVHYNVGYLYTTEIMSIVTGWAILEDAFLSLCNPSRDGNNFAQRFNVLNSIVSTLSRNYRNSGDNVARLFADVNPDMWKYSNLNLATIRHLGTLEFRPYHSTWDIKEIRSWINRIIHFCKGMVAIGTPVDVLEEADKNIEAFITKYAGVPATEQLIDLTRRNISTAFRLAYIVDKWEDVETLRKEPKPKKGKVKAQVADIENTDMIVPPISWSQRVAEVAEVATERADFRHFINTRQPSTPTMTVNPTVYDEVGGPLGQRRVDSE